MTPFCQVLTIKTEANLKQIHFCQMPIQCCIMHQQSYNPLVHELF